MAGCNPLINSLGCYQGCFHRKELNGTRNIRVCHSAKNRNSSLNSVPVLHMYM